MFAGPAVDTAGVKMADGNRLARPSGQRIQTFEERVTSQVQSFRWEIVYWRCLGFHNPFP